jgi:methanethiol S-methyltransferase
MAWKLLVDVLLVIGFGAQHSVLATLRVKRRAKASIGWDAAQWRTIETVSNVVYILAAASVWQDVDTVVWDVQGAGRVLMWVGLALGWFWYWELHCVEYDIGVAFGASSNLAKLFGHKSPPTEMWKVGSRRWIRFPVHTAFFPMFFCLPTMTASLLALAITANVYNFIGSVLYDRRLETMVREPYFAYQRLTGLIVPAFRRAPRGAAELPLPSPLTWRPTGQHLPAVVLGLAGGAFYWSMLGRTGHHVTEMVTCALAATLVGFAGGVLLGIVRRNDVGIIARNAAEPSTVNPLLAQLATSAGVMSATAVMFWIGLTTVVDGHAPQFGPFLPMWFIVLWLAEMSAYAVGRLATHARHIETTAPVAPVAPVTPRPSVGAAAR